MNDQSLAEQVQENLDHIRKHAHLVRGRENVVEFLHAVREVGNYAVIVAGDGHVPIPDQGQHTDLDYAALLAAVIAVNVRVFFQRPHDVRDSEFLGHLVAAIEQLRVGVDRAVA